MLLVLFEALAFDLAATASRIYAWANYSFDFDPSLFKDHRSGNPLIYTQSETRACKTVTKWSHVLTDTVRNRGPLLRAYMFCHMHISYCIIFMMSQVLQDKAWSECDDVFAALHYPSSLFPQSQAQLCQVFADAIASIESHQHPPPLIYVCPSL